MEKTESGSVKVVKLHFMRCVLRKMRGKGRAMISGAGQDATQGKTNFLATAILHNTLLTAEEEGNV